MLQGEDFQKTKDVRYFEACRALEMADTDEEYKRAKSMFMTIVDYKDSRAKIGGIDNLLRRRKKAIKN